MLRLRVSDHAQPQPKGMVITMRKRMLWAAIPLFLLALGLMLYPWLAVRWNALHESKLQTEYKEQLADTTAEKLQQELARAQAYNDAIRPGAQVNVFDDDALLAAAADYDSLLNIMGNGVMGYVSIPKLDVELPICHGTDAGTLETSVGHLLGTSLPVGGEGTHAVLTGHSGMSGRKMFSDLDRLSEGDIFYLTVLGETLAYRVDRIVTVLPYETEALCAERGKDLCTLSTCTPFGVNTHRLLVRGERIPQEEAERQQQEQNGQDAKTGSTWEDAYKKELLISIGVGAAFFLLLLPLVLFIRRKRGNKI